MIIKIESFHKKMYLIRCDFNFRTTYYSLCTSDFEFITAPSRPNQLRFKYRAVEIVEFPHGFSHSTNHIRT